MQHASIAPVVALFLATFENNWGYCIVFWRLALFVLLDFTTARLTITVNVITPLMSWQTGWTQLFSWRRRTDIFQAALTIWIRGQWTMFQVWRKEMLYTTQYNELSSGYILWNNVILYPWASEIWALKCLAQYFVNQFFLKYIIWWFNICSNIFFVFLIEPCLTKETEPLIFDSSWKLSAVPFTRKTKKQH